MTDLVYLRTDEAMTDSLTVAESFGKRHDNVMQAIDRLLEGIPENKETPMFVKTWYKHPQNGERYAKYLMNRDGFSLLVMGFTGKKALAWKLKYISAFNAMESVVREKQTAAWIETRQRGKLARREETDTIKLLVEYAREQGSTHADMLYMTYSRLANKFAGIQTRDGATTEQLNMLAIYEGIALRMMQDGMSAGEHYKDIYRATKERFATVQSLAFLQAVE